MKAETELQCPTCSATIKWSQEFPYRPFCSKRCQLVDFGEWANENHKISGSALYEEEFDELMEQPLYEADDYKEQ